MTAAEIELSKKLLHAQLLAKQSADLVLIVSRQVDLLKVRIDKLEAVVEGMAIGKGRTGPVERGGAE